MLLGSYHSTGCWSCIVTKELFLWLSFATEVLLFTSRFSPLEICHTPLVCFATQFFTAKVTEQRSQSFIHILVGSEGTWFLVYGVQNYPWRKKHIFEVVTLLLSLTTFQRYTTGHFLHCISIGITVSKAICSLKRTNQGRTKVKTK